MIELHDCVAIAGDLDGLRTLTLHGVTIGGGSLRRDIPAGFQVSDGEIARSVGGIVTNELTILLCHSYLHAGETLLIGIQSLDAEDAASNELEFDSYGITILDFDSLFTGDSRIAIFSLNDFNDIVAGSQLICLNGTGHVGGEGVNQLTILMPDLYDHAGQGLVGILIHCVDGDAAIGCVGKGNVCVLASFHVGQLRGFVNGIASRRNQLFHGIHTGFEAGREGQSIIIRLILADNHVVGVARHLESCASQRLTGQLIQLLNDQAGSAVLKDYDFGIASNNDAFLLRVHDGIAIRCVGVLDDVAAGSQIAPNNGAGVVRDALGYLFTSSCQIQFEASILQLMPIGLVLQTDDKGALRRIHEFDTVDNTHLYGDGLGRFTYQIALRSRHLSYNIVTGTDGADQSLALRVSGIGANEIVVSGLYLKHRASNPLLRTAVTLEDDERRLRRVFNDER